MRTTARGRLIAALGAAMLAGCQHRGAGPDLRETAPLKALHAQAGASLKAGSVAGAEAAFRKAYELSVREGRQALAGRYLGNVAACRFAAWDLRGALKLFLQARETSLAAGDREGAGRISANLSSLYIANGDFQDAGLSAERGLEELPAGGAPGVRTSLLTLAAQVAARLGENGEAERWFREAIEESDASGDLRQQAQAWDNLGFYELKARHLRRAGRALVEAYRLETEYRGLGLEPAYSHLSEWRESEGDLAGARVLLGRALEHPERAGVPVWYLHYQAARLKTEAGEAGAALGEYRQAVALARSWREGASPSDSLRAGTARWLSALYQGYIDGLVRDARFGPAGSAITVEAFEAEEEERSATLRQTLLEERKSRAKLPEEYWALLGRYRSCQSALLGADRPELRKMAAALEHQLAEIEARSLPLTSTTPYNTLENLPQGNTLRDIQSRIRDSELVLSFHFGASASCVWAVRRNGFEAHRLPSAETIRRDAEKFLAATQSDGSEAAGLGERVYGELFGALGAEARGKSDWALASDELLLRTPLGALSGGRKEPGYLIEKHALRFVPSAMTVAAAPVETGGAFLGIGDGIYNRADPRWSGRRSVTDPVTVQAAVELPRLVASGQELYECERAWGRPGGMLLTGERASRKALRQGLEMRPAVVHIAAHVLQPAGDSADSVIALGIGRDGGEEVMTRFDVAGLTMAGGTVVMSGCSSAVAPAPELTGVLGLARAWLIAGADAVVGTRWAYPDDTGALFRVFYEHLRESGAGGSRGAADALRRAELEMLRSRSWRAKPKYWASFYEIGKE